MKQKNPKFEIGDKVSMKSKTLYGENVGVVQEITKVFKAVTRVRNGNSFDEIDGLVHFEKEIGGIRLPYRFDGVTLEIDYPQQDFGGFIQKAFTTISEFNGYAYTIKTDKMLTVYSERQLK